MDDPYDDGDEIPDNLLAASRGFLTDPQFKALQDLQRESTARRLKKEFLDAN